MVKSEERVSLLISVIALIYYQHMYMALCEIKINAHGDGT